MTVVSTTMGDLKRAAAGGNKTVYKMLCFIPIVKPTRCTSV